MLSLTKRLHPNRVRRTLGAASCVREPLRLVANELCDTPRVRPYRLRDSRMVVHIRHPLLDIWVLEEVFRFQVYDPPPEAARVLEALGRPVNILDLGGNVGLFGLFARTRFPNANLVSFEPDPGNARLLSACIKSNALEASWRLVESCAATRGGTVEFISSHHLSRMVRASDDSLAAKHERIAAALPFLENTPLLQAERREVASADVFPFLRDADFVKIDIEGSEWEILADPRFAEVAASVVVLEFHPAYSPGADAEAMVRRTLGGAGYATGPTVPSDDAAVLWAWKDEGRAT